MHVVVTQHASYCVCIVTPVDCRGFHIVRPVEINECETDGTSSMNGVIEIMYKVSFEISEKLRQLGESRHRF